MFDLKIISIQQFMGYSELSCSMSEASDAEFSMFPETITLFGVTYVKESWSVSKCEITYVNRS